MHTYTHAHSITQATPIPCLVDSTCEGLSTRIVFPCRHPSRHNRMGAVQAVNLLRKLASASVREIRAVCRGFRIIYILGRWVKIAILGTLYYARFVPYAALCFRPFHTLVACKQNASASFLRGRMQSTPLVVNVKSATIH